MLPSPAALRSALRLRVAWAQVHGAAGQLVTTGVAIALGVALAASILLVNRALVASMQDSIEALAGKADLTVLAQGQDGVDDGLVEVVRATPGVVTAVPVVTGTALVNDDSGESLTIFGVDLLNDKARQLYQTYGEDAVQLADPVVFLNAPDSIIVTRQFMERRGLRRDDTVELLTPSGARSFTIRGVLDSKGATRAFGGSLVVMDVYAAEEAFLHDGRISQIEVVTDHDADLQHVAGQLTRSLPQGIAVEKTAQRTAGIRKLFAGFQLMLDGLALMGLLVGFLIAFNRLSMVFRKRLWEIGVTRALGARRGIVVRELLKESLLLGLGGVALGLFLGVLLAQRLMPAVARTAELNFNLTTRATPVPIQIGPLLAAGVMGLLASVLAAIVPAIRAAKAPAVEVLRAKGLLQLPAAPAGRANAVRVVLVTLAAAFAVLEVATGSAALGLLATATILIAACCLIRPVLSYVGRSLEGTVARCFGLIGRLAVVDMLRVPSRTVMIVSIMTTGLGAVVWFGAMEGSFESLTTGALGQVRRADLIVASSFAHGTVAAVGEDVADEIARIPGVERVSSERLASWTSGGNVIGICAFDAPHFRDPRFGDWIFNGDHIAGVLERVARGDAILASPGFARSHGVKVGDTITLETPSGPFSAVLAGLTVVSLISPTGDIVMTRNLFRRLWHDSLITRAHVLLAPGTDEGAVRAAISRGIGRRYRLQILSPRQLIETFAAEVRQGFAFTRILQAMTLLVVLLGMADALVASVIDRARELSTMRAIGAPRYRIGALLTLQSAIMGFLGVAFAVATGLALATLWGGSTMEAVVGWPIGVSLPLRTILGAVILGILVCAIAAIPPARSAMQLAPADGLRCD